MSNFDKSGFVQLPLGTLVFWNKGEVGEGLNPFTQGYIEEMFRESGLCEDDGLADVAERIGLAPNKGFSDLAPETLARIVEDCGKFKPDFGRRYYANTAHDGALYWRSRAANKHFCDPPLTPYLGDDGKVYLREQDQ